MEGYRLSTHRAFRVNTHIGLSVYVDYHRWHLGGQRSKEIIFGV